MAWAPPPVPVRGVSPDARGVPAVTRGDGLLPAPAGVGGSSGGVDVVGGGGGGGGGVGGGGGGGGSGSGDVGGEAEYDAGVAEEYGAFLDELNFNSKRLINHLTSVAQENVAHAPTIAATIVARIAAVPADIKLPLLYLLDSICKNVGGVYTAAFAARIHRTFLDTYAVTPAPVRRSLLRMLGTWTPVFGEETVASLAHHVAAMDAAGPLPASATPAAAPAAAGGATPGYVDGAGGPPPVPGVTGAAVGVEAGAAGAGEVGGAAAGVAALPLATESPAQWRAPLELETDKLVSLMAEAAAGGVAPRIEQLDALQALLDVLLQTQPDAPQRARISELQGQLATVRAGIVAMAAAEAGEGAAAAPPVSSPLDVARAFSLVSSPADPPPPPPHLMPPPPPAAPAVMAPPPPVQRVPPPPVDEGPSGSGGPAGPPPPPPPHGLEPASFPMVSGAGPRMLPTTSMQPTPPLAAHSSGPGSRGRLLLPTRLPGASAMPPPFMQSGMSMRGGGHARPTSPPRQGLLLPVRQLGGPDPPPRLLGGPDPRRAAKDGSGALAERPLSRKARRRAGNAAAGGNGGGNGGGGNGGKGGQAGPPVLRFEDIKALPPTAAVAALYDQLPHLSKADGMRFGSVDALRAHLDWVFIYNQRKRSRAAGGASRCWMEAAAAWMASPLPGSDTSSAPAGLGGGPGGAASADGGPGGGGGGGGGGNGRDGAAEGGNGHRGGGGDGGGGGGGGGDGDGSGGGGTEADAASAAGTWVQVGDEEREACGVCGENLDATWNDDAGAWGYPAAVRAPDGSVFHAACFASARAAATAAAVASAAATPAAAGVPDGGAPPAPATAGEGGAGGEGGGEPLAKRLRVGL